MVFELKFVCAGMFDNVLEMPATRAGISHLDAAKQALGVPDLNLDKVHSQVNKCTRSEYIIEITEKIARQSGIFQECSIIEITVPHLYLNQFTKILHDYGRSSSTGAVLWIQFSYVIDNQSVIDAWTNKNYPTKIHSDES